MKDFADEKVTLAQGAGGKQTSDLISNIFAHHFANPDFTQDDAAVLAQAPGRLAMSTDGFIVSPPEFPGGNIGKLAVCGTVNDLACMGAKPSYMTAAYVIEEGFSLARLDRIAQSMGETAKMAGVHLVAGDTKVAGRGQVDGLFITTTGLGVLPDGVDTGGAKAQPGDLVLVTGDIGRHGAAILLARNDFQIEADIQSDCAPLWDLVASVLASLKDETGSYQDLHTVRDASRGGVGTVLYEIAGQSGLGIDLDQAQIPVDPAVAGLCGMLGLDPLYLANEGTMVVCLPEERAGAVLQALHQEEGRQEAQVIGRVTDDHPGQVVMSTEVGGRTLLPQPTGELLPRIC